MKTLPNVLLIIISFFFYFTVSAQKKCTVPFFENMGDLPGVEIMSTPSDISADGEKFILTSSTDDPQIANDAGGATHQEMAAIWTRQCKSHSDTSNNKKGLVGLGYLPNPGLHVYSVGNGISPDGGVAVGVSETGSLSYIAVAFVSGKKAFAMHKQLSSSAAVDVTPRKVNNVKTIGKWRTYKSKMKGRIVVGYCSTRDHHPFRLPGARAAYWNSSDTVNFLPIPDLLPDGSIIASSNAICISDDGNTIGGNLFKEDYAYNAHFKSYACIWQRVNDHYEFVTILNDLPGGDFHNGISQISGNGNVIVGFGSTTTGVLSCDAYPWTGVKWIRTPSGWSDPIALVPAGGFPITYVNGVNYDGSEMVGTSIKYDLATCQDFTGTATLWNASGVVDLTTQIGPLNVNGDMILSAKSISADGKTISGEMFLVNGGMTGWVYGK